MLSSFPLGLWSDLQVHSKKVAETPSMAQRRHIQWYVFGTAAAVLEMFGLLQQTYYSLQNMIF